ncbi:MAG: hypothetical protein QXZ25_01335 [Candidatus Bathyarchaeia archaeon]
MPTVSIDTFFACSLMVLLVLSAMAATSKVLYPYINNNVFDENVGEKFREISKYLLLNDGKPSNWGQNGQTIPEIFGLAKDDSDNSYELDIDKVSRLNDENIYALSYAQLFTALGLPDTSFRIEIKPIFEVTINLTATYAYENETVYQFQISTDKYGFPVQAELKCYVVAENYLETANAQCLNGGAYLNITLPNDVNGPAILIVLARALCESKAFSFDAYTFAHNSEEPKAKGTFLKLSPINYTLNVTFNYPETVLSRAYAFAFNYSSALTQATSGDQSATYGISHFLDPSPTVIVITGWNSSSFFSEWTAYPQIPIQKGVDFTEATNFSGVYTYRYVVTINSALYECRVWLGGPEK